MSLFMCAHGRLTCNCPHCNFFVEEDKNESETEEEVEEKVYLSAVISAMRKEKIEY